MKVYFDTEFSERGPEYPIELISLGAVDDYGRVFYAVSTDFNEDACNDWVKEHVLPRLEDAPRWPRKLIAEKFAKWVETGQTRLDIPPTFWAYFADYDWVVLCQSFGTMMDLPRGWPMYCHDLRQVLTQLGSPKIPFGVMGLEHNALNDALWVKQACRWLVKNYPLALELL